MTGLTTYSSFAILAIAAIDDLRCRRVHNKLLLVLALISILIVLYAHGLPGLPDAILGLIAGFICYLPLAWFRIVGGGDLKLMAVLGILVGPMPVIMIGFFSLFWGALMGLIQVALQKDFKSFFKNMLNLTQFKSLEQRKLHKIPYAVAIFFGALTQWTYRGGHLW